MKDYKKILEGVVNIISATEKCDIGFVNICSYIGENCPELAEIKDEEKIRKALIHMVTSNKELHFGINNYNGVIWEDILAWLEKQGEQKPADKVEPKFHEGEYIVDNCGYVWKIEGILNQFYILEGVEGGESRPTIEWVDKTFHRWTIYYAKDGDVLEFGDHGRLVVGIVSHINKSTGKVDACCLLEVNNFKVGIYYALDTINPHPAPKEQRDLLFKKMKEAGYEWNAEKKEMKKVERKPDDKIKPFDEFAGLTDFERTLADICIGWTGEELGWKQYIKDNADVLLKIAIKKFNSVQDSSFAQKPAELSEEDERMYRGLHNLIYSTPYCDSRKEFSDWLNSLRLRIMGLK